MHELETWAASADGRKLFSDDFNHDAVLEVRGDFFNDDQRRSFAAHIVQCLNSARLPTSETRDVTSILLSIVPGPDGLGLEVYAKSVEDVENKLAERGSRIEELESEVSNLQAGIRELVHASGAPIMGSTERQEPTMINGLTEEETSATVPVARLVGTAGTRAQANAGGDSTGAMANAWFGTPGCEKAIEAVFGGTQPAGGEREAFDEAWALRWQAIGTDQVGASAKDFAWAMWQARAALSQPAAQQERKPMPDASAVYADNNDDPFLIRIHPTHLMRIIRSVERFHGIKEGV